MVVSGSVLNYMYKLYHIVMQTILILICGSLWHIEGLKNAFLCAQACKKSHVNVLNLSNMGHINLKIFVSVRNKT